MKLRNHFITLMTQMRLYLFGDGITMDLPSRAGMTRQVAGRTEKFSMAMKLENGLDPWTGRSVLMSER